MAERIKLLELDIDIEALNDNVGKAYQNMKSLEDAQKALKKTAIALKKEIQTQNKVMKEAKKTGNVKAYNEAKIAQNELKKQYEDTSRAIGKNYSELKASRKEYQMGVKLVDAYTEKQIKSLTIIKQTDGSLDQLSSAISKNVSAYKMLTKDERENTEVGGKLKELITAQREEYKKLHMEIGNTSVNVGNYEEDIRSAMEGMSLFDGGMMSVISNFINLSQQENGISGFFSTFKTGLKSATKAGLKFIATPIGAVIAAIVVGIGLFTEVISRNQDTADGFNKVWAGISNVIQEVIGRMLKLAGAMAKILTGDFKNGFKDLNDSVTGFGDAMTNAYKEGNKLLEMQHELEKANIAATTSQAELNAEIDKYSTIQDDATRSFKEREDAAAKVRELEAEKIKENIELAKKEVDQMNLQVEQAKRQGDITRELLQEQSDAQAKLIELEGDYTKSIYQNEKTRRELKQDRLERDLDILLDGYDNQKTVNEKIIDDETQTFEKRRALLDETRKLGNDSFAKQIETIQQFTGKSIDANALISESNAELLNERIRELGLSEIMEGRLLEIVRDRKTATQDLADLQKELATDQVQFNVDLAEKELDLYIANNKSKIDDDTKLTDSIVSQEEKRLQSIYEKELEFLEQEKTAKLISEQDYKLRKINLQEQFIEQDKELQQQYKDYKQEQKEAQLNKEQSEFEASLELKALRGESEYQLELERLKREEKAAKISAKKKGVDETLIADLYRKKREAITQAEQQSKIGAYSATFSNIASFLGEETALGKAAALAQSSINIAQGITKALASKGFVGIAEGVLIAAAGAKQVGKIMGVDTSIKAEHGAVFDIGGKRHSEGGTKFYGEDGTTFEAEKGEKMFVLNRIASRMLGPGLSRINEMYGGVPLSQSSTYLAQGGAVASVSGSTRIVNNTTHQTIDYDTQAAKIGAAVGEANKSLPNPVTDVKDVISEVANYNKIVDGANI